MSALKNLETLEKEPLSYFGGPASVNPDETPKELFAWPYMSEEIEQAVLDVVRNNKMSGTDITQEFEKKFAAWQQRKYGIAYCNGTLSLQAAMFGVGLGAGDELICPTKTYWASCTSAASLGATVVFANVDETMCLDPDDLERCIGPRTKAVMVVHYCGYPADMDRICAICKKHNLKLIEDVSHAQGGRYKGKMLGTFGDAAAMSLMSLKSFSCGELGMLVTDDREVYERAMAYAHYERNNERFITETDYLKPYYYIPLGGMKGRVNQVATAIGLIRLRDYDERIAEIRKSMNYFLDCLEGTPGFRPLRVDESTGSTMAGWYNPFGMYVPEEVGGLSVKKFMEALKAETGFQSQSGANYPLHTHRFYQDLDLIHAGKPTRILFADRDVREMDKELKRSENINCILLPWFVKYMPEEIEKYANGFRKVFLHYRDLLSEEQKQGVGGQWFHAVN